MFRTERSEKKRKELEHICNFNEDRIEKDEKELALAKKTTRDAFEKYEETTRRLNAKEKVTHFSKYLIVCEINFVKFCCHLIQRTLNILQAFEITSKRANNADTKLSVLDKGMLDAAMKMGKSATTRENAAKREEGLKKKLAILSKQFQEAQSRAIYMEEEQQKLEILVGQMKEEKEIVLLKMRNKKNGEKT